MKVTRILEHKEHEKHKEYEEQKEHKEQKEKDSVNGIMIGFMGVEKYEMILYLSRILKQLGKQVLVLDCSENGALDAGICYVREQEEIYGELLEYRGVDYINYTLKEETYTETYGTYKTVKEQYDFTLVDFGFQEKHPLILECNRCFLVTDQQRHNVLRLKEMARQLYIPFIVIIRDVLACKVSLRYFIDMFSGIGRAEEIMILYRNETDTKQQIQCQYSQGLNIHGLSKDTKEFLKKTVQILIPELTKLEIARALKQAERGK